MQYEDYLNLYRDERKTAIVQQASQLFLQKGIEPVKMTDIARHCGIEVAWLYRYFGTKTSLVTAVGSILWNDVRARFETIYGSNAFLAKTGLEQVRELLRLFPVLFSTRKEFLRFLAEFDAFVSACKIPPAELAQYEKSVLDCWPVFQKSWQTGRADGTIRADVDSREIYLAMTHALMSTSQKFLKGAILPSDDVSTSERELDLLVEMALRYIAS